MVAETFPGTRRARVKSLLGGVINQRFDRADGGPGGWWIINDSELHLGDDVLIPAIAGWRRERMPVFPEAHYFDVTPDWVCDIVATGFISRIKWPRYAQLGIPYGWLLDLSARGVECYRLEGAYWLCSSAYEDCVCAEPFEACTLALSDLWLEE
jgi:Uma2 family endonuclease